ncbi:hypothetical protein GC197_10030 [bacterium]|nr:hypothetical protein [bacterium]
MAQDEKPTRQIKFQVTEEQQDMIRLAAALCQTTMAEYSRDIILRDAEKLTKDIKMPNGRRKRKSSSPD